MAKHPEIEIVSRDRGGDYAAAGRRALPGATQTADRFHLLKNLGEALEGCSQSSRRSSQTSDRNSENRSSPRFADWGAAECASKERCGSRQAKREVRLTQYQHMVALREQGFSQTAIAEHVGISHATVSRWLSNGTFPEQKPRPRSASVDPHLPQLVE